jgi:hypothetical protein
LDALEDRSSIATVPAAYGVRGLDRPVTREDAQGSDELTLRVVEHLVAPVQRRAERPLAGWRVAPPSDRQRRALVEVREQGSWAEYRRSCRRQLECQRQSVHPPADPHDDVAVLLSEAKRRNTRPRSLDE